MAISAVGQGQTWTVATATKQAPVSDSRSQQAAALKKDSAVISDAARELAVKAAGKQAAEEANESVAEKGREGAGD
jgi:hypothetical protein